MGSKLATGNSLILGDRVRADNWFENRPFFVANAGFGWEKPYPISGVPFQDSAEIYSID